MSVAYEPRGFMDGNYPPMDEHPPATPDADRYSDPNDPVNELAAVAGYATTASNFADDPHLGLMSSPLPHKEDSPIPAAPAPQMPSSSNVGSAPATTGAQRGKGIPKPEREVTKNAEGKFVCTWPGCTEEVRVFQRKCEWSKHLDKHDRPYKCSAEGCEKLPGFTYSGGLLRHEREVHGKHGGPKNQFLCPHTNCKRNQPGKGFSRQENLNEHLRRVHTQGAAAAGHSGAEAEGDPEEEASAAPEARAARKRKLGDEAEDLREENKQLRDENAKLRFQVEMLNNQIAKFNEQLVQLQQVVHMPRMSTAGQMTTSTLL